jgi:hypothetical protein
MKHKLSDTPAYPLYWPEGTPRLPARKRQSARFKLTMAAAREDLLDELKRLGARYAVISTDVPVRQDGLPYANTRHPEDPGVAVYFDFEGAQMVFACDKWNHVADNVRAIGKTIQALRGIARWGSRDMMKQSFSAFKALPPSASVDWRATLGIRPGDRSIDSAKAAYRAKAAQVHPDRGGSHHEMQRINEAWEAAKKELG